MAENVRGVCSVSENYSESVFNTHLPLKLHLARVLKLRGEKCLKIAAELNLTIGWDSGRCQMTKYIVLEHPKHFAGVYPSH